MSAYFEGRLRRLQFAGIRGTYLRFMWNGYDVRLPAPLEDVTSPLFLFGKSSTSPPSPEEFHYVCSPFPSCARLLDRIAREGAGEKDSDILGRLYGDEVGCVVDIPVGLCSQDIWGSVFFISNALVWMFLFLVFLTHLCAFPLYFSLFCCWFCRNKNPFLLSCPLVFSLFSPASWLIFPQVHTT